MSRYRIYVNGKPTWTDNEPAAARRAGFGGSALGHFQGIVLTHAQRKAKGTADAEARAAKRRSA